MRIPALLLSLGLVAAGPVLGAAAQDRLAVRVGDHADHGRMVLDWQRVPNYRAEQEGDRVLLHFPDGVKVDMASARQRLRNVVSVRETEDGIELTVRPGARLRHYKLGNRLIVDILDPPPGATAAAAPAAPPAATPAAAAEPPRRDRRNRAEAAAATPAAPPTAAAAPAQAAAPQSAAPQTPAHQAPPAQTPSAQAPAAPAAATPAPAVATATPAPAAGPAAPAAANLSPAARRRVEEELRRADREARRQAAEEVRRLEQESQRRAEQEARRAEQEARRNREQARRAAEEAQRAERESRRRGRAEPAAATPPAAAAAAPQAAAPAAAPAAASAAEPARAGRGTDRAGRPGRPEVARPEAPRPEAPRPEAAAAPPAPVAEAASPASAEPVQLAALAEPNAVALRLTGAPGQPRAVVVPLPSTTGAAVLRRGEEIIAIFDSARPLDLAALRNDPVFGQAETQQVSGGTLLRLRLAAPAVLRARRDNGAWVLEPARTQDMRDAAMEGADRPLVVDAEGGERPRLLLRANGIAGVVSLVDPLTGLPLLVGTLREARQPNPVTRRLPELELLESSLGVAVLARADTITLRPAGERFVVAAEGGRLALDTSAAAPEPTALTRSFDLPELPLGQLSNRFRGQQAGISTAAPLARGPLRLAAAETLLSLGLPQEAQAMALLAAAEDPRMATNPPLQAIAGMAALVGGRLSEAGGLDEAALPITDELVLWRGLLAAARGDANSGAPGIAATLPLLLSYAEPLRQRLLPMAGEALAEARDARGLKRLLDAAGEAPELALPRAMLAELENDTDRALAGYERVANGRDRLARARALRRSVELRLAANRIDAAEAARLLDATLFAWRGDNEEINARRRLAQLRRAAGDGRGALALLRETESLFPEQAAALRGEISAAFLEAIQKEPPLAAVAMFDAFPDMLPNDAQGEATIALLADRLAALDLPERAGALLTRAIERTTDPATRAGIGLRLANLRLNEGDAVGALGALELSAAEGLPGELSRDRVLLAARAEARRGGLQRAISTLQELGSAGAEPIAELLTEAQDWAGAAQALGGFVRGSLPPAPAPLADSHRRGLVRLAALLALAGDDAGLSALRNDYAPRMQGGALAEAFTLLTADPLRGLSDLPRLQQELQLFRAMPARLEALRGGAPVAR